MMMTRQNTLGLFTILAMGTVTAHVNAQLPVYGRPTPTLTIFDDVMQSYMDYWDINAGVLAVSVNGNVVYQHGFGSGVPENTLFRLASVEKPITAAAIQRLVADGHLSMNDNAFDLGQFGGGILPHQPYNDLLGDEWLKYITVMDLLNHQGGWDRGTAPIGDPQFKTVFIANELGIASPADTDDIISYMLAQPVDYIPGTNGCTNDDGDPTYCYSNFGYMVLGKIVEEVSGMSLLQYVRTKILTPSMDVPNQELIFGRTFDSWNSPREPTYQCSACSVQNVFNPGGSQVQNPYGGWHHEAFMGHGNLVASAAPLLEYMDRYQVGVQSGAGVPLPSGSFGNFFQFNGAIDGISTTIRQRGDAINIVVLLSKRQGVDHAGEVAGLISNIITNTNPTWPTGTADGFWTDFNDGGGLQVGGYHHPFGSMSQAIGVGAGAKVRLKPGSTSWTGTISHRVRFDAPLGTATIGQ